MTSWLGRGYDAVADKPFGWAWHQERDEIRAHLRRRPWRFLPRDGVPSSVLLEQRVSRIQERIHKNRPSYAQRSAAWSAQQRERTGKFGTNELLDVLQQIADGHNDPRTLAAATLKRWNRRN